MYGTYKEFDVFLGPRKGVFYYKNGKKRYVSRAEKLKVVPFSPWEWILPCLNLGILGW